jgi:hypothetical protein
MRWYAVLIVFVIAWLGAATPAAAQRVRPLDQILPQIRATHPGTFYDAEGPFRGPDGRMHYRLKWMTPSGRIIWLDADAATGRVLGRSSSPRYRDRDDHSQRRYAPHNTHRQNWQDDRRRAPPRQWRQRRPARDWRERRSRGWRDRDDDGRRGRWPYQ